MTDKATPPPSPSLYEKIERYGAYRFAHGHNEANQHYDIADREKANAAALLVQIHAEVERLAAQAAPTEQADLRQLMGMNEAEIDAELLAAGISPDDAVKRADRAIKEALATIRAERRAIMYGDIVHNHVCAMRAAVVASHLESPEAGMRWIVNTLFGPGHLPDVDEAIELGGAQAMFDKEMAEHEAFRAAHPAPVVAQPSQAPVVQAVQALQDRLDIARAGRSPWPVDEDAIEAEIEQLLAQQEAHPPLPQGKAAIRCVADTDEGGWVVDFDCEGPLSHEPKEGDELFTADQMHAYLDADRASSGATTQAVRMLTTDEILHALVTELQQPGGVKHTPHEIVQRKFCEVNKLPIPPSGVIGGAA